MMKTLKSLFAIFNGNFSLFLRKGTALTILTALLGSICLFKPERTASAEILPIPQLPTIAALPPESFILPNNTGFISTLGAIVPGENVVNFFNTPTLPEGFENAKVPSVGEKAFSAVSSRISSVFGFFAPNSTKSAVVNAAASPLPPPGTTSFDFDGDGKADVARWQSSNGEWKIRNSSNSHIAAHLLGVSGNQIAPADYDGDGKTDSAVFNASAGSWSIRKSSDGTIQTITGFGQAGDKAVSAKYDGDSFADAAVYRNGVWYVKQSSTGSVVSTSFGQAGDLPVVGNYDGDSAADYAVYRPSSGDWHVLGSSAGYFTLHWGIASDIPVPADYDGDGKIDFSVYRGATGSWYIYKSSTNDGSYITQDWGNYGDQPVPADYDGDGKADVSIWRN